MKKCTNDPIEFRYTNIIFCTNKHSPLSLTPLYKSRKNTTDGTVPYDGTSYIQSVCRHVFVQASDTCGRLFDRLFDRFTHRQGTSVNPNIFFFYRNLPENDTFFSSCHPARINIIFWSSRQYYSLYNIVTHSLRLKVAVTPPQ